MRDALTLGPRDHEDTVTPHTRPPADDDADHMLVRTVECLDGHVEIELVCEPAFDYGSTPATWTQVEGADHAADAAGAGVTFRLVSDLPIDIEGESVRGHHVLQAGERAYCALSWAEELAAPQSYDEAAARIDATTSFWRRWLSNARIPDHRLRDPVQRSALTIKGLTYMPTGATVAALTTSLPETPGGERNWDYRYTWIRDTTFTLQALHFLNLDWEAGEFMEFVADLEPTEDGSLQIMYGIDGRRDLRETTRDDLTGYSGARPVRIGNGAFDQTPERRLRRGARLDPPAHAAQRAPAAAALADRAGAGRVRDAGLAQPGPGDLGGARQAAALRLVEAHVLGRARPRGQARGDPGRPRACRRSGVRPPTRSGRTSLEHGVRDGVLRQHYETDSLDASTLLAAIFGFLPGDDETLHKSVLAIANDLTEDGFVLRYRTDETDDGLSGKEGTFLICSFWLVSALAIVGEQQAARDLMERLLRVCVPARPVRRGVRRGDRPAPRQLPAGVLAPGPDRGGRANHRPRDARGVLMDSYDVIIIGTGAGGGTLARSLAPSGKRILLLERGDWLPREPANWLAQDVFVDNRYVSPDTWYDEKGTAVPAPGALLRRRRDEALRRRAVPAAAAGLRRARASRRDLARLADHLRRARALLHAGRAGVRGARSPRRGSDRGAGQRAVPVPGRLARAPDPAARRRSRGRRLPPVPCAVRDQAQRAEHAVQRLRPLPELRRLPLRGAREVGRRGARGAPGARALERHAAHERQGA